MVVELFAVGFVLDWALGFGEVERLVVVVFGAVADLAAARRVLARWGAGAAAGSARPASSRKAV